MFSTHRRDRVVSPASAIGSAIVAALVASVASAARAQTYTFTSVANSTNLSGVTTFSSARINDNGAIAFVGSNGATTSNAFYLKMATASSANRVVGNGDATPAGSTYKAIEATNYSFDSTNRFTFTSTLSAGGPALFVDNANTGMVTTVLLAGSTVLPSGGTTSTIGNYSANNNGAIAVQLTGQTSGPTSVIYEYSGSGAFSSAMTVAANGETAPNSMTSTGTTTTFGTFAFPVIDNNGVVTFFSNLTANVLAQGSEYRAPANGASTGTATKIVVGGDPAPGTGGNYFNFAGKIVSNDALQAAFFGGAVPVTISNGTITPGSPQVRGVWFAQPDGTLSLVALQGQSDGDGAGGNFGATFTLGNMNNSGTGVFYASGLTGPTMTAADYIFTSSGSTLLLGVGQSLLGSTVVGLGQPWINNSGQVAGNYTLANGQSGIFQYAIGSAAAPEPGSLAVLVPALIGGASVWGMRRHCVRRTAEATRA